MAPNKVQYCKNKNGKKKKPTFYTIEEVQVPVCIAWVNKIYFKMSKKQKVKTSVNLLIIKNMVYTEQLT